MIFISHSWKDKDAAQRLRSEMLARGYDASQLFLDSDAESGIPIGSRWREVLYARLKECNAFLVICSSNLQKSKWCFAELIFAQAMGKQIFPLFIEDCVIDQLLGEQQAVFVHREGEKAYVRLFAALDNQHLGPTDDFGWPPKDGDWCPYPGLPSFDERLAGVYFGREQETQLVIQELRKMRANGEPRFLMIVGGSGSGKSSLLRAGVLPRLRHKVADKDWLVLPTLRFGQRANEQQTILDQLAIYTLSAFPTEAAEVFDSKNIRGRLNAENKKQTVRDFLETLQDLIITRKCPDATVLISVDQFEELLTAAAGATADSFCHFLQTCFSCPNGRILGIGTMRSDHLDIYERSSRALPSQFLRPWRLGPLPRERFVDVIRKPADRAKIAISDALVEKLIQDTPTTEALPLLAFALEKLYRVSASKGRLELNDYNGVEGSIQDCINRIVPPNTLPPSEAAALRLSFVRHLAQVNDKGEVVRRTALWVDLPELAKPILDKFVNERLLTKPEAQNSGGDGESVSVEVAHEAIFRCWDDLKNWLRTSATILRWRRDVQRDRANDPNWSGLRRAQLAVARDWPNTRREELTSEEIHWIKKSIVRQRIWLCVVAAIVVIVTMLAGVAWWQKSQVTDLLHQASRRAYGTAQDLFKAGEWRKGIAYLGGALESWPENSEAADTLLTGIVWGGDDGDRLPRFGVYHRDKIYGADFSLDGKYFVTASDDGDARVCDTATGVMLQQLHHSAPLATAHFDSTGRKIVTATHDGFAYIWDAQSGLCLKKLRASTPGVDSPLVESAVFSPDDKTILTAAWDHTARIFNVESGEEIARLTHGGRVACAVFNTEGSRVVIAGWDGTARVWDTRTHLAIGKPMTHGGTIRRAVFSHDGVKVITSSLDRTARIWDAETGEPKCDGLRHEDWVWSVAASPTQQLAASASIDGTVRLWELTEGAEGLPVGKPLMHDAGVETVSFSKDGNWIVTASRDNAVRIWDVRSGELIRPPMHHDDFALCAIFSPDGSGVLSTGKDRAAYLWSTASSPDPGALLPIKEHSADNPVAKHVRMTQPTEDRDRLQVVLESGEVDVWSISKGEFVGPRVLHGGEIIAAAWHEGRRLFATAGSDSNVRIWSRDTGAVSQTGPQAARISAVAFSYDGKLLLTGDDGGFVSWWHVSNGERAGGPWNPANEPGESPRPIFAIASSPTNLFAAGGQGSVINFGQLTDGPWHGRKIRIEDSVLALSFHPNGKILASGSVDHTVRLWSLDSLSSMGSPFLLQGPVGSVHYCGDGRRLLLASSSDKKAYCYSSKDYRLACVPFRHPTGVIDLSANFDGSSVFSVGTDGVVREWRFPFVPVPPPAFLSELLKVLVGMEFSKVTEKLTTVSMAERVRVRGKLRECVCDQSVWARAMVWSLRSSSGETTESWSGQ